MPLPNPATRVALTFAAIACLAAGTACAAPRTNAGAWVDAWSAPPDSEGPAMGGHTLRQVVRLSTGGTRIRLRFSNREGSAPLALGPVRVARQAAGPAIVEGSGRAVTFHGKPAVSIPKGADVLSDPLELAVKPGEAITVSLYVPTGAGASTVHGAGIRTAYAASGDTVSDTVMPGGATAGSRFFLRDVEVEGAAGARTFVAFGDSITDGLRSTLDRDARWPDALAARLQSNPALRTVAVANAGISGNRLLSDDLGPSALARFDRDALDKPGVRSVLVMEGINDIGESGEAGTADAVSADQVIDGLKRLIGRAHARKVAIWGGTLAPFGGVAAPFHSDAGEAKRQRVNAWIRDSGAFDAVVDFDHVLRDPAQPDHLLPAYDSGDHLHPNDAGYRAMADAIDLDLLKAPARRR